MYYGMIKDEHLKVHRFLLLCVCHGAMDLTFREIVNAE